LNRFIEAGVSFRKRNLRFDRDVLAAGRTGTPSASGESLGTAEDIAQDISQVDIPQIRKATAKTTGAAPRESSGIHPVMTETVVSRALLRIGENLIRFINGLEVRLRAFIAGVLVRVIFDRLPPVGRFYFVLVRTFGYPKES
jgi:hypothetical protein